MAEDVRNATTEHPAAEPLRQHLERIENDLAAVIRFHLQTAPWSLVVAAVVETTGTLAELLIVEEPTRRAAVLKRIDELQLHLSTVGARPQ